METYSLLHYLVIGIYIAISSIWITGTYFFVYTCCGNLLKEKKVGPVTAFVLMVVIDLFIAVATGYLLVTNM